MQFEFPSSQWYKHSSAKSHNRAIRYETYTDVTKVKEGSLIHFFEHPNNAAIPRIIGLSCATAAGAAPLGLWLKLKKGAPAFNLLGPRLPEDIERIYHQKKLAGELWAVNEFFKPNALAALSPLANLLRGHITDGVVTATIKGVEVKMPINNGSEVGQEPAHLHGLAYALTPKTETFIAPDRAELRAHFASGYNAKFWAGQLKLDVTHTLKNAGYEFHMKTTNSGERAIPAGAGAQLHLFSLSQDPSALKLFIPAGKVLEIDNNENQLATGRLLEIEKDSELDFNLPHGKTLGSEYFDHLWVDLELNSAGFAYIDFIDEKAPLRVRLTATTPNIKGIQVSAPQGDHRSALGIFATIAFVTHLPDPREEVWGDIDTGMKLLKPGESLEYGFRIEIFAS